MSMFVKAYNETREHGGINGLTPSEMFLQRSITSAICTRTNQQSVTHEGTKNLSQNYLSTDDHKTGELDQSKVVLCLLFIPCEQFSEPVVP